jgi:hypothetical protein
MILALASWLWLYLLLIIEAALVLLGTKLAFDFPAAGSRYFSFVENGLRQLAENRALSITAITAAAFLLRGLIFPISPIPEPSIHDEFSFLLAGDTFAHGRLTNPTHPMWVHFESMHIQHQPSYASMYPPGQGLVLALGERFGNPFYGVWMISALMCGAICWMLQGWFSPGWALFGAALAVIRFATFNYWSNSYMVGALPAAGGALLLGAVPRLLRAPRFKDSLLLGTGVAVLVNTRPYEGGVLSAFVIAMVLYKTITSFSVSSAARKVVGPLALILLPTLVMMAYYNWRVFGNAFTLPYQLNRATYSTAGVFLWQSPAPHPVYRHKAIADFYLGWELPLFEGARTLKGFLMLGLRKLTASWQFFVGPALTLPLLVMPSIFRDRRTRPILVIIGVYALALVVQTWFMPHYAAPITSGVIALLVQALRHVSVWRWKDKPVGMAFVRMVPTVCIAMLVIRIGIGAFHVPVNLGWPNTWATVWRIPLEREQILSRLASYPSRHLVLLRYGPRHDPFREYVYNASDIDSSPVVWAREMDREHSARLIQYFHDRQVWLLEPDEVPAKLSRLN